jgi:hypothetical protein
MHELCIYAKNKLYSSGFRVLYNCQQLTIVVA